MAASQSVLMRLVLILGTIFLLFGQWQILLLLWLPLSLLLISYWSLTPMTQLTYRVITPPKQAQSGQSWQWTLVVQNSGARAWDVGVEIDLPVGVSVVDGDLHWRGSIAAQGEHHLILTCQAGVGYFPQISVQIFSEDLLGWAYTKTQWQPELAVTVLPKVDVRQVLPWRSSLRQGLLGQMPVRQTGQGEDLLGLRGYQLGDKLSQINWRRQARNPAELVVTERNQSCQTLVQVIVDMSTLQAIDYREQTWLTPMLEQVMTLVQSAHQQGHQTTCEVLGGVRRRVSAGLGRQQAQRIGQAMVEAVSEQNQRASLYQYNRHFKYQGLWVYCVPTDWVWGRLDQLLQLVRTVKAARGQIWVALYERETEISDVQWAAEQLLIKRIQQAGGIAWRLGPDHTAQSMHQWSQLARRNVA